MKRGSGAPPPGFSRPAGTQAYGSESDYPVSKLMTLLIGTEIAESAVACALRSRQVVASFASFL